jgi:hypothetical protein
MKEDNLVFREKYGTVVKQFQRNYCHPICGLNCKFYQEKKILKEPIKPMLYRQTQYVCINCKEIPISEYNHNYCHLCATMDYVLEFQYHHQRCEKEK